MSKIVGVDPTEVWNIVFDQCLENGHASEQFIADKLGVSRTPVRETLRHLQEDGLVIRHRPFGIRLRQPAIQEMLNTYDVRAVLEGFACRLLAASRNEFVLTKLKEIDRQLEALGLENRPERVKKEVFFHQTIVENCGNPLIADFINKLHIITTSFLVMNNALITISTNQITYSHTKVLRALEFEPPEKAEEVMRKHIEEGKQDVLRWASKFQRTSLYKPLKTAVNGYFEKLATDTV